MFWAKNMKIVKKIKRKIVIFTAVKNRCMLHWRVFVMSAQADLQFCCMHMLKMGFLIILLSITQQIP